MKRRNFNEIYGEIIKKGPELNLLRRKLNFACIKTIILSTILLLMLVFFADRIRNEIIFDIIVLIFFLFGTYYYYVNFYPTYAKYKYIYKNDIISKIVKAYSLSYNAEDSITEYEYRRAKYYENFNDFYSKDLIEGFFDSHFNIRMSKVCLRRKDEKMTYLVFKGLFGIVQFVNGELPDFSMTLNKEYNKYSDERIEIDSAEFEKFYDLYTTYKVETMEIFTSDVIELLNEIYKEFKKPMEIKTINGLMYFRIKMLEPLGDDEIKKIYYDNLYNIFRKIDLPIRVIDKIYENTNN